LELFIQISESPKLDPIPKSKLDVKRSEKDVVETTPSNTSTDQTEEKDKKDTEQAEESKSSLIISTEPPANSSSSPRQQGYRKNGRSNHPPRAPQPISSQSTIAQVDPNSFKPAIQTGVYPTQPQGRQQNFKVSNQSSFPRQKENSNLIQGGSSHINPNVKNIFSTALKDVKVNTPRVSTSLPLGNQNGGVKPPQSNPVKPSGEGPVMALNSTQKPRNTYSTPLKDCGTSSKRNSPVPVVRINPRQSLSTPLKDCKE